MSEAEDTGDVNAWMVTFSDLLMLMLTFFVLLLSMSQLDAERLQLLSQSGVHERGAQRQREGMATTREESVDVHVLAVVDQIESLGSFQFGEVADELFETLAIDPMLQRNAWLEHVPEGIAFVVDGEILFEGDSATLRPDARMWVRQVGGLARVLDVGVRVESWCAPEVCAQPWEQALERGTRVVMELRASELSAQRLGMVGYGHALNDPRSQPLSRHASERPLMPASVLRLTFVVGAAEAHVW
jgi:chemotaxis protein MotB